MGLHDTASEQWDDARHTDTSQDGEIWNKVGDVAEGDDQEGFCDGIDSQEAGVFENKAGKKSKERSNRQGDYSKQYELYKYCEQCSDSELDWL